MINWISGRDEEDKFCRREFLFVFVRLSASYQSLLIFCGHSQ